MRPQVGQVINNKYRLVRLIGDGGMGSVFECRHEVLGTTVALKFLHPELSRRQGLVQRFLQEARVSAQIQSPHVVRVIDVDQNANSQAFIVMEYLQGRTLQALYEDLYRAGQQLSYADALEYAMQMLEGVEAAHRTGVVHRDLKPDNVMITTTPRGEPLLKLLDFGIAKLKVSGEFDRGLTRPGVIMGTPEYMAPEQAYSADKVDVRADIFSLGVMIFEMLAGRRPVGGDEPHQIASAYLSGQIAMLGDLASHVAPELCAAVHRAIAPMPADRFETVAAMREAIEPFARAARAPSALTPPPATATPLPAAAVTPADASGTPGPGAAISTPAAAVSPVASSDQAAVPKTIPPEGELPPVGSDLPATTEAAPLHMAGLVTPLGGFSADPGVAGAAAPAASPAPVTPIPAAPIAAAEARESAVPATVSAEPYVPPNRAPGGTVSALPLEPPRRPGGTAVGAAPMFLESHGASAGPAYAPAGAGYTAAPGLPGTAPMEPLPGAGVAATRRPGRSGPPLLLILLSAAGIAGAVVGGVYIANEVQRRQGGGGDGGSTVPTTTVTQTAQPLPTPTPTPTPTPEVPPPSTQTTTTPPPPRPTVKPTSTAPTPSTTTTTTATATTTTTTTSTRPPIIIIPSQIPTTFPPGGWPLPIPGQPTSPPPTPTATSTATSTPTGTTTTTRKRINIPGMP